MIRDILQENNTCSFYYDICSFCYEQNTYNYTYVYNFDQNVVSETDNLERSDSVLSSASTVDM